MLSDQNNELLEEDKNLTKQLNRYTIDIPNTNRRQTEDALRVANEYTINAIIDYLNLDNYELVKNLAQVTNSENAAEIIAHRDWGLARNFALKELLINAKAKKDNFADKIKWKKKEL